MKVTPISFFKTNSYKPHNTQALPFGKHIEQQNDSFVSKTKPLNKRYSTALAHFMQEVSKYIMNTPKITYDGLYDIVEKYSSDVMIKKFFDNMNPNKRAVAQYCQEATYRLINSCVEEEISGQTIYVNIPKKQDKTARALLLGSVVHEAVHMFQHETKADVSGESFLKKYFEGSKSLEDAKHRIEMVNNLHYGYSKFEQNIFTLTGNFLNECFIPSYANLKNFDKFLIHGHGMNFEEIAKFLIEDAYYNSGDDIIDTFGENSITDYIKEKLEQEKEAYKAENEVMQKHSPSIIQKMDSKFTVEVYEKLSEIVNNLKSERIN